VIDFELNDEQKAWQKKSRDFAEREIRPLSLKIDRDPSHVFPWDIFRKLAQEDLLFLSIPEEYGGRGLDPITIALIIEELAVGDAGWLAQPRIYSTLRCSETKAEENSCWTFQPRPWLALCHNRVGAGSDVTA
jgi:alkylation response protein AidB-like acyl-CoA dehydrogenase